MADYWVFLVSFARWILGSVLLLAALTKLFDLPNFQRVIIQWHIGQPKYSAIIAGGIPGLEILIGVALLLNFYSNVSAAFGAGLLTIFTIFLSSRLMKGETEGCGCFGTSKNDAISFRLIVRNLILLSLALLIVFAPDESWNPVTIPILLIIGILFLAKPRNSSENAHHTVIRSQGLQESDAISRRNFLKIGVAVLGAMLVDTLGIKSASALSCFPPPRCCCNQTYSHWEAYCYTAGCSFPNRKHHIWTRICESCYCGRSSSCRTTWCCCTCTCESCGDACDTITPHCGCACSYCNPCVCSDGQG